jgi:hypothetical protein
MIRLGAVISEAIDQHYGRDELLRRLAHPFWFQSFGAVEGMDSPASAAFDLELTYTSGSKCQISSTRSARTRGIGSYCGDYAF